jgi:hypothetical protein
MKCWLYKVGLCVLTLVSFSLVGQQIGLRELKGHRNPQIQELVDDAVNFLREEGPDRACVSFLHDDSWWTPNVKLFVVNPQNQTLIVDDEYYRVWQSANVFKTLEGEGLFPLLRKEQQRSAWLLTFWNDDLAHLYVRQVEIPEKAGAAYYVGALFFVHSPRHTAMELVLKTRVFLLQNDLNTTIQYINNPIEDAKRGSLTVALYDSNGICLADSYTPSLVGRSIASWLDDKGNHVLDSFIKATNTETDQGWAVNIRKPNSNLFYLLACGYYPQVNRKYVIKLGRQAADFIKENGEKAFEKVSSVNGAFNKGRLSVVVYDTQGIVKAHSTLPMFTGSNFMHYKDQLGLMLVQKIIDSILKKKETWVHTYKNRATEIIYCKKVEVENNTYIVTVQGFTPFTEASSALGLVELGYFILASTPTMSAYRILNGLGDLSSTQRFAPYGNVFAQVYYQGFCIGQRQSAEDLLALWGKLDEPLQEQAEKLRKENKAGGWVRYTKNGRPLSVYVRVADTPNLKDYVVIGGYYNSSAQAKDRRSANA